MGDEKLQQPPLSVKIGPSQVCPPLLMLPTSCPYPAICSSSLCAFLSEPEVSGNSDHWQKQPLFPWTGRGNRAQPVSAQSLPCCSFAHPFLPLDRPSAYYPRVTRKDKAGEKATKALQEAAADNGSLHAGQQWELAQWARSSLLFVQRQRRIN